MGLWWSNNADFSFFFFQAEDGIRDWSVTGVQTCALPIYIEPGEQYRIGNESGHFDVSKRGSRRDARGKTDSYVEQFYAQSDEHRDGKKEIGRASCRERV